MTRKSDTTNEQISRSKISLKHSTNKITSTPTTTNEHYNMETSTNTTNNNNIDHFNMDLLNDTTNIENFKMDIITNNTTSSTIRKSPITTTNNNSTKNVYISDNSIKLTKQNFMMTNDISTKIFTTNKIINYNNNLNEYDTKLTRKNQPYQSNNNQNKSCSNPKNDQHSYGGSRSFQSKYDTLNTLSSLQFQYKPYSMPPANNSTNLFHTNFIDNNESSSLSRLQPIATHLLSTDTFNNDTLQVDTFNYDLEPSSNNSVPNDYVPTSNIECNSIIKLCHSCNKKLPITFFTCKCGQIFCNKHRHAESHNCTFDYKTKEQLLLRKNIETVVADKVKKI